MGSFYTIPKLRLEKKRNIVRRFEDATIQIGASEKQVIFYAPNSDLLNTFFWQIIQV